MDGRSLVSVIVIFLNAARFFREALDSVLAQTYDRWELLLVDDGSTDGSTEIAQDYAAAHPEKVRCLEHRGHRNLGMSASRNLGIRHARGDYVALLDADDVWLPDKLGQQVALLDATPEAGMVYGPTQYWHSWTGDVKDAGRDFIPGLGTPAGALVRPPQLLVQYLRNEARSPGTCSVLLRRKAIERAGGFEDRFRGLHEDQAFFAKVCFQEAVLVTGECTARYRQHPDSCCAVTAKAGQGEAAQADYLNWLAEYVCKHGGKETEVWHILRRGLWPDARPSFYRWLPRREREALRRLKDSVKRAFGHQPRLAYEAELIPPLELMRREGVEVLEEWFRWAEEWSMLLRLYGQITRDSAVLEIECGLGRIAFPLRYVLSPRGSFDGFDMGRDKIEFLAETFQRAHANFRFAWADIRHAALNPGGRLRATDYQFPYADQAFDIVYSSSAFNHILPEAAEHYLREAARTLKPQGRCLFGVFLLDNYRPGQPRPLGFARPAFDFDHPHAAYGGDFAVADPENPERMTAFSRRLIERMAAKAGLELAVPPAPGLWSGSTATWVGAQDLVVLKKAG
jgi:glycosyltransferase involved in cell wall biosynthesis